MNLTLKPGLLVALKSTVAGGVSYARRDLEQSTLDRGAAFRRWETECTTADPEEHARAVKVRTEAVGLVRRCCVGTSFGLLCVQDREGDLDAATLEARRIVDAHNQTARYTFVTLATLKGRIATTDESAARAILGELGDLMRDMDRGIQALDPETIREAATKARELSAMLSDEQAAKVSEAVQQARTAARAIVARVEKKGEDAATVLASLRLDAVRQARVAFLDLDGPAPAANGAPTMPAVNVQRFALVDDGPEPEKPAEPAPEPTKPPARALDLEGWV